MATVGAVCDDMVALAGHDWLLDGRRKEGEQHALSFPSKLMVAGSTVESGLVGDL